MRKYTVIGSDSELKSYAVEFLKMGGYECVNTDETVAKKFLSKTVLLIGNVDLDFLRDICSWVRVLVYVGNDEEVKDIIRGIVEEKDIPVRIKDNGISGGVEVYYNDNKTFEIYSSIIYSEFEMVNKYLLKFGPKISLLVRYISQYMLSRNTASFDYSELSDLKPLHIAFQNYSKEKIADNIRFEQEELINLFNTYRP